MICSAADRPFALEAVANVAKRSDNINVRHRSYEQLRNSFSSKR